jgi:plasmid stabilization system protein ParE
MGLLVEWTEPAGQSYREAVAHIQADNAKAADRIGRKILSTIDMLAEMPTLGAFYDANNCPGVRQFVVAKYRIFYRVLESRSVFQVLLIWHGSRDEPDFETP